jgi:hypothetical protein
MMWKWWPFFALLLSPSVGMGQSAAAVERAVNSISPEDIARHIGVMAHDLMLGRSTPSPELEATAIYVAGQFRQIGLTPRGNDGTFMQRYLLLEIDCDVTISFSDGTT